MSRIIIIGQAPSRASDPREPLSGRSGARLASLCGLAMPEFLARFERWNLLDAHPGRREGVEGDVYVGVREARRLADGLLPALRGRFAVVLGATNAAAFRITAPAFEFHDVARCGLAWSPHPSGVSRWWNDAANEERARAFWRSLAEGSHP